jgi:glycosyltransferase involved in cell wall biosynthesis
VRLAWFSPWPPQPSGIAGRSAELVPELCRRGMAIDVFVDEHAVRTARADENGARPGQWRVQSAHEFIWRMRRGQYDVVVYQVGNSRLHDYLWPYLFRWPGLTVLHDARLHHARARARMDRRQFDAYRDEFRWNHPEVSPEAAELAIAGFGGSYFYLWPMLRSVIESSRAIATHSRGAIQEIARSVPADAPAAARPIEYIALGEGDATELTEAARQTERARLGHHQDQIVLGVFGGLSADKRVEPIVRTVARLRHRLPQMRLLLVGAPGRDVNLGDLIQAHGITDIVTTLHDVDDAAFGRLIATVDVSLNLRWPTALETSGPWLRALAAARATIVIALAHQADVPALDPRTWLTWPGQSDGVAPVTIALDILDEEHSLELALEKLVETPDLRRSLGVAAREYWRRRHTLDHMAADYERVLAQTAALPFGPGPALPFVPGPLARITSVLSPLDVTVPLK